MGILGREKCAKALWLKEPVKYRGPSGDSLARAEGGEW